MRLEELSDRSYLVGGASRGIGRAVAGELVAQGARVLLMSRGGEALEAAAGDLGMPYVGASMDDPGAADHVRERVDAELGGRLDGILMNAGGPKAGEALALSDDDWRVAYELLLAGPLRLLRALDPLLSDGSAIAWVMSSSVRQPIPNLDASNVFRPGLAALVKVLARELAPRVRVNGLAPGRIDTDRVRSLNESQAQGSGRSVEEVRADSEAEVPLGRYGEPAEIARVAAFMLSPAASYVSGVTLQVDGALVTALP